MARIEVKSEVTGKVWVFEGKVGQKMDIDEPIMIIESMKMEIPVSSDEGGSIVELMVQEGEVRKTVKRSRFWKRSIRFDAKRHKPHAGTFTRIGQATIHQYTHPALACGPTELGQDPL